MLHQFYKFPHGPCLNNFLQAWLIGNQGDQVTLFRYINRDDEVHHLDIERIVLGDMNYLMRLVKLSAEAVVIWTDEN